jgi:hypothetical protein
VAHTVLEGCHVPTTLSSAVQLSVAWECLFVYDTLLVVLTLLRGRSLGLRRTQSGLHAHNVAAVVVRDGALYYGAVALANLANVLTFYAAPPLLKGALSNLAGVLSTALCSRLMLNLHAPDDARRPSGPSSSARMAAAETRAAFTSGIALDELQSSNARWF